MCLGSHLAEHSSDEEKADRLVARLAKVNNDWDSVCEKATDWQTRLQKALLEVISASLQIIENKHKH